MSIIKIIMFPSINHISLLILLLYNLRIVFDDVRQASGSHYLPPEVIGFNAVRIRRVTASIVIALVEWKEPGVISKQFSTKTHFLVIHREVDHAPAKLK